MELPKEKGKQMEVNYLLLPVKNYSEGTKNIWKGGMIRGMIR